MSQRVFYSEAIRAGSTAGVDAIWLTCLPGVEEVVSQDCRTVDATHLVLKILPHALNARVHDRGDVLGTANVDEIWI